jgi:hypothetical protein
LTLRGSIYLLDWRHEIRKYRDFIKFLWLTRNHEVRKLRERVLLWIVWRLPKEVIMWAYVRVAEHATTGKYGDTEVPELTMMDALKRWDDDRGR